MTDTYTKLFASITESTIVSEPVSTRWLWVTMLAMCDSQGKVYGSIPGLARRANLSLEETERGLATFFAPDPYSRTKDNEGRRIEEIPEGGWRLLNHSKYADMRSEAERRLYKREWDRNNRGRNKSDSKSDKADTNPTNPTPPTPPALTLDKSKDQKKKQPPRAAALAFTPPDWIDPTAWTAYLEMRKRKRAPATERACVLVVAELEKLRRQGHDPTVCLDQSTRNAWTDVYAPKNGTHHANSPGSRKLSVVEQIEQNIADRKQRERDAIDGEVVRRAPG